MLLHFLCSGHEYKESKMEKSAYCGLGAKIPGAGGDSWRRTAPALRGSCMDLDLHHLTGSFCLRRGCVASRGGALLPTGDFPLFGGLGVLPEVVTSVGGRPAGSRYLRWGASCRKSLPPLGGVPPEIVTSVGGRPAGSRYLRWGASRRKGFLCLERVLPDRVISSSARCP